MVGFKPGIYHGVFLAIHILNLLITFLVIKDCVIKIKPGFKMERVNAYAGVVALLFAIHPLQVESVAWISASKVILYGFFTLLSLWMYIRFIQKGQWVWYVATVLFYILGFGSKEQTILLPLLLLSVDWLYGRFAGLQPNLKSLINKVLLEKVLFFVLAGAMWYFSWKNNLGNLNVADGYPIYQRLLFGAHSLVQYVFRSIAPVKLYYYYFYPIHVGEPLPMSYWGYLVLVAIMAIFVWNNWQKNNRLVVFGAIFMVINLLLVLHLMPMPRKMITADRYMYLSMIGIALVLVWFLDYLHIRFTMYRKGIATLTIVFFAAIGFQSFLRTREWKDSNSIKSNIQELIEKRKEQDQPIVNNPIKKTHND